MSRRDSETRQLLQIYQLLLDHFGPLHWWPADSPFEVMVGAILTQNTAWTNVEKAIANLKRAKMLSPSALERAPVEKIAELIRPSGYFNQKAARLHDFVRFFLAPPVNGKVANLRRMELGPLRELLLSQKGIGPETADSIILYALGLPVFVVDAYTRRAFHRLGLLPEHADYDTTQRLFTERLPVDVDLYNDLHAQIVFLGKDYCKKKPRCGECPLVVLGRCLKKVDSSQ